MTDWSSVEAPWTRSVDEIAVALRTDAERGLEIDDAAVRIQHVGANELVEHAHPSAWTLFFRQFANTMTAVLSVAAAVTLLIGDRLDTAVILGIVVLNGIVGFVQEERAERAMAALLRLAAPSAHVVRGGDSSQIDAADLVPGDLVVIGAGDVVPADLRLVSVHGLRINEAPLTGEAEPVTKAEHTLAAGSGGQIATRDNMAFKGTPVTSGRATGIVVATGMTTELGSIAAMLQAHGQTQTPLQQRLNALGRRLAAAALVVCAAVFGGGTLAGEDTTEMFLTAVTLAVAAIPEGLPAVVTVALALGARRMAEHHALIRNLPAVETLGSVTVICTDKTGTLTQNRMAVEQIWTPIGTYSVSGDGYAPEGAVAGDRDPDDDPFLVRLASVAAACNDATLHAPTEDDDAWTATGDPTEAALLALAPKLGVDVDALQRERPRIAEIAFEATRRRMTTFHASGDETWVATKGALGALDPLLLDEDRALLAGAEAAAARFGDEGYRVLAVAEREVSPLPDDEADLSGVEHDLRLVGLVAIADPPRPEAADAVATCRGAGMVAVMITGDHPRTAVTIAQRVGLLGAGASDLGVLTGDGLDALDDEALAGRIASVRVFARIDPEQKLRIVDAWKARGAIVAMTGDGVNDAPALRRADIGVAMGLTGSDVSREASDMVLADDNFATIVEAVREGRRIYDNIRRFVRYLLTTNSGELWVMFLAPLLGLPIPLLPIQILWINLVTDGLPAIALGVEPAEPDTMRRPPRAPDESILARGLWQQALGVGLLMAATCIGLLVMARDAGWPWQTMVFTTLALMQLGNALAVRSERVSIMRLGLRTNIWLLGAISLSAIAQLATIYVPALRTAFDTEPLDAAQLAVVVALSMVALVAVELTKLRHRGDHVASASGPSALGIDRAP